MHLSEENVERNFPSAYHATYRWKENHDKLEESKYWTKPEEQKGVESTFTFPRDNNKLLSISSLVTTPTQGKFVLKKIYKEIKAKNKE